MSAPLLEVEDVRKSFDAQGQVHVAVSSISFTMEAASSLAIVGESGAGKSTVARIVVGLETPDSGSVRFDGVPRRFGRHARRERQRLATKVQMVFQDPYSSLDPRQRIGDAIGEVLVLQSDRTRKERRERVDELLARVGLDGDYAGRRPNALSGGQRQRVAIARALAAEPELLVLDEAVSALDVSVQSQVLNLLADIRRDTNLAYLVISHDLAVVRHLCDDAIVLRHGEVVETGPTERVIDDPQDSYTRDLVAASPGANWSHRGLPTA